MGLTKQYLRYGAAHQFGVVASTRCNVVWLQKFRGAKGRYAAVANCENVCVWDVKTQQRVMVLTGEDGDEVPTEVTVLAARGERLAVGRTDGSVQVFDVATGELEMPFNGHRSPISALAYDHDGLRLVSGSHDGDLVVWDLVDQKGLYRLKGHQGMITCCRFVRAKNMMVTSSKDSNIKWWDLDVGHCFKTIHDHRARVWQFVIDPQETTLITGSDDSELRAYSIKFIEDDGEGDDKEKEKGGDEVMARDRQVKCSKLGSVMRRGTDRVVSLRLTTDGRYLVCHGNRKRIEVFRMLNEEELVKKRKKKAKKARKRKADKEKNGDDDNASDDEEEDDQVPDELVISDMVVESGTFDCCFSISSIDVARTGNKQEEEYMMVSVLRNNKLQVVRALPRNKDFASPGQISKCGHRSESRSACFSSSGKAFVTTGAESIKLWNRSSQQCVRTLECVRATCCLLVPGDRHLLHGTQAGLIELDEIQSGERLQTIKAHQGAITCMTSLSDGVSIVTGGNDKKLNFYQLQYVTDEEQTSRSLRLASTRVWEMEESVLDVKFTPDKQLLAVALLDSSVRVLYADSLKLKFKLYEHSLPVNSISVSYDSTLIVTGSRDRNVIIWGLDFGNKHKKLFAHNNDVTCVEFVPETHLFFTCGKDGFIKQWDADKFILIQVLKGHLDGVWYVVPSRDGDFLLSSSDDKSLRVWQRTQEPIIPDEEREQEREAEALKSFADNLKTVVPGEKNDGEVSMASKTSAETLKGADQIVEALDIYRAEVEAEAQFNRNPQNKENKLQYQSTNPRLVFFKLKYGVNTDGLQTAARYVLHSIETVRSSDLEETLLVIPFLPYVVDLLKLLNHFLTEQRQVELACRCVIFLLKIHHGQITANSMLVDVLRDLKVNYKKAVGTLRDRIGFNLAALGHIRRHIEARDEVSIFADATDAFNDKKKRRKKRDVLQRNILAV